MTTPDVDLTDEQRLFQSTVRDFCEVHVRPLVAKAEASESFPRDALLPAMAALGFFRIGVPEEHGGAGGDSIMHAILAEEVGRICGGFAASIAPCVLGPSLLLRLATPAQRAAYLESVMNGRCLFAIALTEPGAGSDLFSLQTTARVDGEYYEINGSKTFITNGPLADVLVVAALSSEHAARTGIARAAGIGLYFVPRDTPGFSIARKLSKLGMRSSETAELVFDACRIPEGNRVGGREVNFLRLLGVLDQNRLYVAALSLGIAQAAFEAARAYAQQRTTFGKPIGDHQAIGFMLARMAVDLDAARLLIRRAARVYDAGTRASGAIAKAKWFATEAAVRITGQAVQIHGGYGYMTELPLERYFRDAKVGTIWEGTSEIQQLVIAQELGLLRGT
jgi:alkylation response protein AidB-like acyl-CoA dehydrogenase